MREFALVILFLPILACAPFAQPRPAEEPDAPPIAGPSPGKNWAIPDLDMNYVYVEAGTFRMGSAESGPNDEKPVHVVRISRGY